MNSKAFKLYAIIGKLSLFPGIYKGTFIKGLLYGRVLCLVLQALVQLGDHELASGD
jgi:hypothetical protein